MVVPVVRGGTRPAGAALPGAGPAAAPPVATAPRTVAGAGPGAGAAAATLRAGGGRAAGARHRRHDGATSLPAAAASRCAALPGAAAAAGRGAEAGQPRPRGALPQPPVRQHGAASAAFPAAAGLLFCHRPAEWRRGQSRGQVRRRGRRPEAAGGPARPGSAARRTAHGRGPGAGLCGVAGAAGGKTARIPMTREQAEVLDRALSPVPAGCSPRAALAATPGLSGPRRCRNGCQRGPASFPQPAAAAGLYGGGRPFTPRVSPGVCGRIGQAGRRRRFARNRCFLCPGTARRRRAAGVRSAGRCCPPSSGGYGC